MLNVIGLVGLIATAALLAWSSIRAWRAKSNFLKWGRCEPGGSPGHNRCFGKHSHDCRDA